MTQTTLPSSPYADHTFLPFPEDGSLYDNTEEMDWMVVLRRNGDIDGPDLAITFPCVQHGMPDDVIAYHRMNPKLAAEIADARITQVVSTTAPRKYGTASVGAGIILLGGAALIAYGFMPKAQG